MWAMAALSLMPIWAFMYVRALTAAPEEVAGPMGIGLEAYGSCQSCHGAAGEGGSGRQMNDGEVWLTFPNIEDHIRFVYFGTDGYNIAGVSSYGDPARPGGEHRTGEFGLMPGWGSSVGGEMSDSEILSVVCHERYGFAGGPDVNTDAAAAEEFENWCAEESPVFAAVEAGTPLADLDEAELTGVTGQVIEFIDIGSEPVPGSSSRQ